MKLIEDYQMQLAIPKLIRVYMCSCEDILSCSNIQDVWNGI